LRHPALAVTLQTHRDDPKRAAVSADEYGRLTDRE